MRGKEGGERRGKKKKERERDSQNFKFHHLELLGPLLCKMFYDFYIAVRLTLVILGVEGLEIAGLAILES